ncbi:MAG: hypothetical protein M3066_04715 [Actinomycetota bacterium]|nr:hypothetical protein [Actinomycetota bacterium]
MPSSPAPRRTGVLIIRAWIEERSGALRAHVTSQLDIERGTKEQLGADEPGALVRIVEHWVDRFATEEQGWANRTAAPGCDGDATGR